MKKLVFVITKGKLKRLIFFSIKIKNIKIIKLPRFIIFFYKYNCFEINPKYNKRFQAKSYDFYSCSHLN